MRAPVICLQSVATAFAVHSVHCSVIYSILITYWRYEGWGEGLLVVLLGGELKTEYFGAGEQPLIITANLTNNICPTKKLDATPFIHKQLSWHIAYLQRQFANLTNTICPTKKT